MVLKPELLKFVPRAAMDLDPALGIQEIRYIRITRLYKTYCELFPRGTEILGPVCANSGIAESGIRVIDCS